MSRTQFLSILRECSGAPRSKMRISFLYYTGSFAVWRGVEYGLVHAVSSCTGGVRRQFENCGYRRQYSKSAYAPLCRRWGPGLAPEYRAMAEIKERPRSRSRRRTGRVGVPPPPTHPLAAHPRPPAARWSEEERKASKFLSLGQSNTAAAPQYHPPPQLAPYYSHVGPPPHPTICSAPGPTPIRWDAILTVPRTSMTAKRPWYVGSATGISSMGTPAGPVCHSLLANRPSCEISLSCVTGSHFAALRQRSTSITRQFVVLRVT